jgi:hypothetical protein
MKIDRKNYKGIEYILVDELPQAQRERLLQTLGQDIFIKIMMDGKIVSRCIQYKDYNYWFENTYASSRLNPVREPRAQETVEISGDLALKI